MDLAVILARIEERLTAVGLSATAASANAGLTKDAIRNMRRSVASGSNAGVSTKTISALAPVLGTTVEWLMATEDTPAPQEWKSELTLSTAQTGPVLVAGKTAAGVFREVDDMDQSEPEKIWEPLDPRFPNARRMAFDVEGDSMNDLKPRPIFNGDRAICVSFEDVAGQVKVRDDLVVVVERTRDGGHTREWSLKQVELFDDRTEFHPRSTNPKHKPIVVMKDAQADDGVQVEIIGLVRAIRNEFPI